MAPIGKRVLLGKVAATHGVRGQLRVVPYSGDPGTILSLASVILTGAKGETDVFRVAHAAVHGKRVLLSFNGFDTINQVQHLVGRELYVEREQLPELPPGEFYWFDLLGLRVVSAEDGLLGTLDDIIATGSNDVYVVRGEGKEYLIPALEDVVLQVSLDDGVMTVSLPEGLSDL
jgi:16S rRNA processing protein RimM